MPTPHPSLSTRAQRMRAWTYQQGYPLVRVSLDEGGRVWLQQVWSLVALGWLEGWSGSLLGPGRHEPPQRTKTGG